MDEDNKFFEGHFPRVYDDKGNLIPGDPYYSFLDEYESAAENSLLTPKIFAEVSDAQGPYGTSVPEGINITVPRKQQRTIAQGRDFYVVGTINIAETIPPNAELSVTLKDKNNNVVLLLVKQNTIPLIKKYILQKRAVLNLNMCSIGQILMN